MKIGRVPGQARVSFDLKAVDRGLPVPEVRSARCIVTVASGCLVLLALGACGGTTTKTVVTAAPSASTTSAAGGLQQSFASVIKRVSPAVVQISNPQGLGSGVVYDNKGDVVTNAHVVAGGGPLKVTDARGHTHSASIVGSFPPDDLAVVNAHSASLPSATFAASGSFQVGDIVLAIGNPLGLRSSVTEGIISALGRTVDEPNGAVLPNVVQTSAAINPGNSGGALVALTGDVVGIPTLAATDPELGGSAAPGIGFAIPSSLVTKVASQIVKYGHVVNSQRAFLGVSLATGLANGAVVASVQKGGPAARAGIAPGDAIVSIAGQPVSSPVQLAEVLATLRPGQSVKVGITKPDGTRATLNVTLGQYPGRSS
jgi:putative serine protease PepD